MIKNFLPQIVLTLSGDIGTIISSISLSSFVTNFLPLKEETAEERKPIDEKFVTE